MRRPSLLALASRWRSALPGASISAGDATPSRPVRLDVIATDARGRIVDTLTPADFDVREDGAVQSIDEARFIRTAKGERGGSAQSRSNPTPTSAPRPRGPTRVWWPCSSTTITSARRIPARVRTALLRFVDEYLAPRDLLVVMRPLDSLFTIRLTRDRDRSRQAILDFSGRQGDYTPRNNYERNYIAGTPARIEQLRAQVTTSALNALALHVGHLDSDARKTLIIVSEDLPRADRRRGLEGLPTIDTVARSANRVQRVGLRGRPGVRSRWTPQAATPARARCLAVAGGVHQRPVHRERVRSGRGDASHRVRFERVLPVALQDDAG